MHTKRSPRNAHRIATEQVHKWATEQRRQVSEVSPVPLPSITISREYGAQGLTLGDRLSRRLGFTLWDRQIVDTVAGEAGISDSMVSILDECANNRLDDFIAELLMGGEATSSQFVEKVVRVIRLVATRGGAVIIGRGAQFIVEPENALRVRLVSPVQMRVAHIMRLEQLGEREAQRRLRKTEAERAGFIRRHFGKDVTDPLHSDLVVNTGSLSMEHAAAVVVAAYETKFSHIPGVRALQRRAPVGRRGAHGRDNRAAAQDQPTP